jgi:peroxiredoxin
MATAYEILGLDPEATRAQLEAAYAAKSAAYAVEQVATLPEEFQQLAAQRRAELASAYHELRPALTAPPRLEPEAIRRRDRETIIILFVLLLLAAAVPLSRGIAAPARTATVVGAEAAALTSDIAPDFTLQTVDGRSVSLSDYKGKVVVINFWATWCPPCVREIPRLVRVADTYKDQGLVMLGINTTFQDDAAKVARFGRDQNISYPILLDSQGAASQKYPSHLMPTTYLIDREGKIVHTKVGEVDEAALMEQVEALLAHP